MSTNQKQVQQKPGQSSQPQKVDPIEQVRRELAQYVFPKLKSALPPHITPERFMSAVMTAVYTNPKILECDRSTFFTESLKCAGDGLIPDGREAAFVPFKGKVKYIPMVYGLIKRAKQGGDIVTMTAEVIHEKDIFKYWVNGDGQNINFEPDLFGERGKPVGAFALAKTTDGYLEIEPMTYEQIMAVKNVSAAKDSASSPWNTDFESEMWRKSVIRRLSKRLTLSPEIRKIFENDDEMYELENKKAPKEVPNDLSDVLLGEGAAVSLPGPAVEVMPKLSAEFEAALNETPDPMRVK